VRTINDPIRPRVWGTKVPLENLMKTAAGANRAATELWLPRPVFSDPKHRIEIYEGDCLEILGAMPEAWVDVIFADPPYFLSNDGITCHAGRMVSVNKGDWDRSRGPGANHEFNRHWLAACQRALKPDGTIWVSGTSHVIHSVGFAMQQLGFKLLNDITWVKPNPPPNLSCRYFTHATETVIWAAKSRKSRHTFNYELMRQLAGGKQMKSVWEIPPPEPWEKRFGKHPTQKPVALIERILLASSNEGDLVLDPFLGSGTTAVAALRLARCVLGIDSAQPSVNASIGRLCGELVFARVAVTSVQFTVDLDSRFMDRSGVAGNSQMAPPALTKLVRRECNYYFVGANPREVIYSVMAATLDEAWQKFHSSTKSSREILFVVKTETEIYLA